MTRSAISHTTEEVIRSSSARRPVDYVLVYSANAAEALVATIRRPELEELFEDAIFACISGRVAEALGGRLREQNTGSRRNRAETALLSLLEAMPDEAS